MIQFRVYGEPKGQPRPRAFARKVGNQVFVRAYDPGTAEEWKSQIAIAAKPVVPTQPIAGPVALHVDFYFSRPKSHLRRNGELKPNVPHWHTSKPDRDNCEKAVLDALTAIGFWLDDKQVCAGSVRKFYANPGKPGAEIIINRL